MAEGKTQDTRKNNSEKLKVFISYSRADEKFADELVDGLNFDGGFDVTIDRHSIKQGEKWKPRLAALIEAADTVVFILSPESVSSEICQWEVDEAERLKKRLIPVLYRPLGEIAPPKQLADINYIDFTGSGTLMAGVTNLVTSLKEDLGWLKEGTRLLNLALNWKRANRRNNRLLSGQDIVDAKNWMAACPKGAAITELQRDFIKESDREEEVRKDEERQRLAELASASKRVAQRTMVGLFVSAVLGCVAVWFGWQAHLGEIKAQQQTKIAQVKTRLAEQKTKETKAQTKLVLKSSAFLSTISTQKLLSEGAKDSALLKLLDTSDKLEAVKVFEDGKIPDAMLIAYDKVIRSLQRTQKFYFSEQSSIFQEGKYFFIFDPKNSSVYYYDGEGGPKPIGPFEGGVLDVELLDGDQELLVVKENYQVAIIDLKSKKIRIIGVINKISYASQPNFEINVYISKNGLIVIFPNYQQEEKLNKHNFYFSLWDVKKNKKISGIIRTNFTNIDDIVREDKSYILFDNEAYDDEARIAIKINIDGDVKEIKINKLSAKQQYKCLNNKEVKESNIYAFNVIKEFSSVEETALQISCIDFTSDSILLKEVSWGSAGSSIEYTLNMKRENFDEDDKTKGYEFSLNKLLTKHTTDINKYGNPTWVDYQELNMEDSFHPNLGLAFDRRLFIFNEDFLIFDQKYKSEILMANLYEDNKIALAFKDQGYLHFIVENFSDEAVIGGKTYGFSIGNVIDVGIMEEKEQEKYLSKLVPMHPSNCEYNQSLGENTKERIYKTKTLKVRFIEKEVKEETFFEVFIENSGISKKIKLPGEMERCIVFSKDLRHFIAHNDKHIYIYTTQNFFNTKKITENLFSKKIKYKNTSSKFFLSNTLDIVTSNGGNKVVLWKFSGENYIPKIIFRSENSVVFAEPNNNGNRLLLAEYIGFSSYRLSLYSLTAKQKYISFAEPYKWYGLFFLDGDYISVSEGSSSIVTKVPNYRDYKNSARNLLSTFCKPEIEGDYKNSKCWIEESNITY